MIIKYKRSSWVIAAILALIVLAEILYLAWPFDKTAKVSTGIQAAYVCTSFVVRDNIGIRGTSPALVRCTDLEQGIVCYVAVNGGYVQCFGEEGNDGAR